MESIGPAAIRFNPDAECSAGHEDSFSWLHQQIQRNETLQIWLGEQLRDALRPFFCGNPNIPLKQLQEGTIKLALERCKFMIAGDESRAFCILFQPIYTALCQLYLEHKELVQVGNPNENSGMFLKKVKDDFGFGVTLNNQDGNLLLDIGYRLPDEHPKPTVLYPHAPASSVKIDETASQSLFMNTPSHYSFTHQDEFMPFKQYLKKLKVDNLQLQFILNPSISAQFAGLLVKTFDMLRTVSEIRSDEPLQNSISAVTQWGLKSYGSLQEKNVQDAFISLFPQIFQAYCEIHIKEAKRDETFRPPLSLLYPQ